MELNLPKNRKLIDPKTGRFVKGTETWNKGVKGLKNTSSTKFKKGELPWNTQPLYTIRIGKKKCGWNCKEIKIAHKKWIGYHRFLWELHYGPIPPKHIVTFKNGDSMDYSIENLECISKSENVKRNHNRKKASVTMKQLWRRERTRFNLDMPPLTRIGENLYKHEMI